MITILFASILFLIMSVNLKVIYALFAFMLDILELNFLRKILSTSRLSSFLNTFSNK